MDECIQNRLKPKDTGHQPTGKVNPAGRELILGQALFEHQAWRVMSTVNLVKSL